MSDSGSDDEDYGSEVEEDEEKSSEGEEENESPEDKAAKILNDIDTIKDIFLYIDNTTQRLRSRIQWEDEKEQYQQELETMEEVVKHNKAKGSSGNDATKNIAGKNEEYEVSLFYC